MRTFEVKDHNDPLPISSMGPVLRNDYRFPPWNEDRMCPSCKGMDDYGPQHVYGEQGPDSCPFCGSRLVSFWSDERLKLYLDFAQAQPNFLFLSVYEQGEFASWLWGHDTSRFASITDGTPVFYIDVFAAMPQFRGSGWERSVSVFRKVIIHMRKNEVELLEPLVRCDDLPVYGSMFLWLLHHKWRQGCRYIGTRTHAKAEQVKSLLSMFGFRHVPEIVSDDPDRQYWLSAIRP